MSGPDGDSSIGYIISVTSHQRSKDDCDSVDEGQEKKSVFAPFLQLAEGLDRLWAVSGSFLILWPIGNIELHKYTVKYRCKPP